MKYSIIVPIYNAHRFLIECIESVLKQSYADWELLLLDDGSVDGCGEICEFYVEKCNKIRFFTHENQGVSMTRNRGLDLATGEYVVFLDADDELTMDALSVLTQKIQEYSPDIVVYNTKRMDEHSIIVGDFTTPTFNTDKLLTKDEISNFIYKSLISNNNFGIIGNYAVKRSLVSNIRFDCDLVMCEDLMFNMKMYEVAQKVLCIPNYFYLYRDNLSGCVRSYNLKKIHSKKKVVGKKIDFACKHKLEYDKYKIYNWFCSDLIYDYWGIIGDKDKEKEFLTFVYSDNDIMNMYMELAKGSNRKLKHPNFRYIMGNRLVRFLLRLLFQFRMVMKNLLRKR